MTNARRSRALVIDASVAAAAGRTDHPVSKACRDFLEAVLKICHHVVLTREIRQEWNKHQSNFTALWRSSMYARKKVARPQVDRNDVLRTGIANSNLSHNECEEVLKDVHLVEAALAADLLLASLDDTARASFRKIAHEVGSLQQVVWVNPAKDDERAVQWLGEGARDEESRRLGSDEAV